MTRKEMYELLKAKKKATNWNNKESIHAYNEYARQLRKMLD